MRAVDRSVYLAALSKMSIGSTVQELQLLAQQWPRSNQVVCITDTLQDSRARLHVALQECSGSTCRATDKLADHAAES